MSDIVREYGKRCAEEAEKKRISDIFQIVKNLMEAFKFTADQAMATIKLNEQDQLILREMFA